MNEKSVWMETTKMLTDKRAVFGAHWSYNFFHDPKRLGFVLSRYKFAAKMGAKNRTVLELGCSDGIGAPILAEHALHYTGVDFDHDALKSAEHNLCGDKFTWIYDDFMGKKFGVFQTVVCLDVIEHIYPDHENQFLNTLANNVDNDGLVIVGTPNLTSAAYASQASQLGHVNLFTLERLKTVLEKYFHTVFPFGMNDEIVHTGFSAMAHYILCIACEPIR